MKKTSSLTISVLASVIVFATAAPVVPASANGFMGVPEQLMPFEMPGKYVDQMDLQSENVLGFFYTNSNLAEDGWLKAGVISNGQLVDDYGGGICQVSSTLYNATVEAGMAVVEPHTHSKTVGYVPVGMNATIAYGYMDFQFVNPYDFEVKYKSESISR